MKFNPALGIVPPWAGEGSRGPLELPAKLHIWFHEHGASAACAVVAGWHERPPARGRVAVSWGTVTQGAGRSSMLYRLQPGESSHRVTVIQPEKDIRKPLLQLPDQSRASSQVRPGCSELTPVKAWKLPRMENLQPPGVHKNEIYGMRWWTEL